MYVEKVIIILLVIDILRFYLKHIAFRCFKIDPTMLHQNVQDDAYPNILLLFQRPLTLY